MDVRLRELAARQDDLVARWQLTAWGWSPTRIDHWRSANDWRSVHKGVYVLSQGELTRHQRWLAATLTSPGAVLSHASAAACWGFREFDGAFEVVTTPGSGGRRRIGALLVCRSATLAGHTTTNDSIPITTPERTLMDLAPHLDDRQLNRAFREALRLGTTTTTKITASMTSLKTPRGTARLGHLATHYRHIPYKRTRSDAEAFALEQIHDAGGTAPRVNVRVSGEEADLVYADRKEIVEIDGPQYHEFPEEDARKAERWRAAGYRVRRVHSDDVYDASYRYPP
jgi:very-short-patch-repair endonuclease